MDACLHAALTYRSWGWSSIAACNPKHYNVGPTHSKYCKSPGKVPPLEWKYWQTHLPDPDEIKNQFHYFPGSNVCVVTGKISGIIGVDVDGDIEELQKKYEFLYLPKTVCFRTHRGMRFLYQYTGQHSSSKSYKYPEGGIDILSDGKQTVAPPSIHQSGSVYSWLKDVSYISSFPKWEIPQKKENDYYKDSKNIKEGERNTRLFKAACGARRHGAEEKDLFCLLKSMNERCTPPLSENDIRVISKSASKYTPSW